MARYSTGSIATTFMFDLAWIAKKSPIASLIGGNTSAFESAAADSSDWGAYATAPLIMTQKRSS